MCRESLGNLPKPKPKALGPPGMISGPGILVLKNYLDLQSYKED